MKLLYFAWLRSRIGRAEEQIEAPDSVRNVGDLLDWLETRGPGYAGALADRRIIRIAVNQDFAELDHVLAPGDEVALFPPITGG